MSYVKYICRFEHKNKCFVYTANFDTHKELHMDEISDSTYVKYISCKNTIKRRFFIDSIFVLFEFCLARAVII